MRDTFTRSDMLSRASFALKAVGLAVFLSTSSGLASAEEVVPAEPVDPISPPASLKTLSVPEPSNLSSFVRNKEAAVALGKALFWEMRIGSDGEKACASCHFSAGTDNRLKNQLAPAKHRQGFHTRQANDTLTASDFPFVRFSSSDKNDSDEQPVHDVRDVAGSQGVFSESFDGTLAGEAADVTSLLHTPDFTVNTLENGPLQVYQVTGRNTPTVINAIFNLRNFWDGRAQTIFNGVNGDGKRDLQAAIYVNKNGTPKRTKVTINDASIASLATGPILDTIEESAVGRTLSHVGKRVISMRALAGQDVALDDSVLGVMAKANGDGLTKTYKTMIKQAFRAKYWKASNPVSLNGESFSQMEANFGLFAGLSIQTYIATLVSDDAPFDRFMEGDNSALSPQQLNGLSLFMDKGKCVNCHGGAAFTNAAIERKSELGQTERLARMIMGDGEEAVYDEAFYNIGVTRTEDDLGIGGTDRFGNPLSLTRVAKQGGSSDFYFKELDMPNVSNITASDRAAVDGAFKVPTLRNVALTAPYFHNGGTATLRQVVEFYNRGGNFPSHNANDLTSDITALGLSDSEIDDIVAFLESLTDERVVKHAAPFDHPMIEIADGFTGDKDGNGMGVDPELLGAASDIGLEIPAVGASGYANPSSAVPTFSERLTPVAN